MLAEQARLLYSRHLMLGSLMTERRIETSIEINAPPSRVWTLLTDFARMPAWNLFIKSISGRHRACGSRFSGCSVLAVRCNKGCGLASEAQYY
jgi:uncharacterized membrane protein